MGVSVMEHADLKATITGYARPVPVAAHEVQLVDDLTATGIDIALLLDVGATTVQTELSRIRAKARRSPNPVNPVNPVTVVVKTKILRTAF
jgi:hypothetical protein